MPPTFEKSSKEHHHDAALEQQLRTFFAFFDPNPQDIPLTAGERRANRNEHVLLLHRTTLVNWDVHWNIGAVTSKSGKDTREITIYIRGILPLKSFFPDLSTDEQHTIADGDPTLDFDEPWFVNDTIIATWSEEHDTASSINIEIIQHTNPLDTKDDTDTFTLSTERIVTNEIVASILTKVLELYRRRRPG